MRLLAPLASVGIALAVLGACSSNLPRAAGHEATGPGSLRLFVDGRTDHPAASTELWLRGAHGTTFAFFGRGDAKEFPDLEPGRYEVAARIPSDVNGPWIYAEQAFEVRPGEEAVVRLEPGRPRAAKLVIETTEHTPPFLLLLAEESATFPADLRELGERLDQRTYPDGLRFAMQSDGRSHLEHLPDLEAGVYTLFQVANDWQPGDPVPSGRTTRIELLANATTTVVLEDRLRSFRVSIR